MESETRKMYMHRIITSSEEFLNQILSERQTTGRVECRCGGAREGCEGGRVQALLDRVQ